MLKNALKARKILVANFIIDITELWSVKFSQLAVIQEKSAREFHKESIVIITMTLDDSFLFLKSGAFIGSSKINYLVK